MKECSKCKETKSLDNFAKCSKSKSGLQSQCKKCKSLWIKENNWSWKQANPEAHNKWAKEKSLKNYHKNKVRHNVSRMIRAALVGYAKSKPTFESLEYTLQDLKEHLESKFQEGMTWDNYGEWHIDHIIPQSKLKYTSTEDENFKKCWSLDNLQPLWAKDNLRKGNRIQG
jgi:hypothetical protein